jgi:hypothetical protein
MLFRPAWWPQRAPCGRMSGLLDEDVYDIKIGGKPG